MFTLVQLEGESPLLLLKSIPEEQDVFLGGGEMWDSSVAYPLKLKTPVRGGEKKRNTFTYRPPLVTVV